MYGLAVYVKQGLSFAWDLSLENSAILTYVFDWLYFTQCLTSFSSIDHLLCRYAWFLILFHLTQRQFSQSTHLLMCLSLKTLTSIFKDWLTYSGGTDRPGELCTNFSISNDLTQIDNFLTWIPDTLTVMLFWIYLFLLTLVFALQWLSLHWKILIILLSQFALAFQ